MASRSLDDLHPEAKSRALSFIKACHEQDVHVLIYCTLRTKEEQNALYEIGRTKPGRIVTTARGGESWHQYGRAFDFVPMLSGKPQWTDKDLYTKCGNIAEQVGLEWAGRWTGKLKETAHCQYTVGGKKS